jgi:hypothetical protein
LTKIIDTGKIQLNSMYHRSGGLAGVKEGFQYMQEGRVIELIPLRKKLKLKLTPTGQVGAKKITYSIWGESWETPKDIPDTA